MPDTEMPVETPLAALHQRKGARMGSWFGCSLPNDWGDPQKEQSFVNRTVALIDKNYHSYLSFTGPDRTRYLNAILTNNIRDLSLGQANVSLLLNPQGRILAEIETRSEPERLFCISHAMVRDRLITWLEKYVIMDDVVLTDETERYGTLALEGPAAPNVVQELTGVDLTKLPELTSIAVDIKPLGNNTLDRPLRCELTKRSIGTALGAEFLVHRDELAALWTVLSDATHLHAGGPMGYSALSAQRLAQGVPWFGYDFGEKQIPHEAGLQDSHISYTKGCYIGQEIVERVRARGHVNRTRVSLLFAGTEIPSAGAVLSADGKEVGAVTRAAQNWFPPSSIAMAYVRKENSAARTILNWSGGTARVINPLLDHEEQGQRPTKDSTRA
ncbi:MAG: glycine cleavage system aminomethyltransferase GcvT [Candidatus Acidiferrum sp.]